MGWTWIDLTHRSAFCTFPIVKKTSLEMRPRGCVMLSPGVIVGIVSWYRGTRRYLSCFPVPRVSYTASTAVLALYETRMNRKKEVITTQGLSKRVTNLMFIIFYEYYTNIPGYVWYNTTLVCRSLLSPSMVSYIPIDTICMMPYDGDCLRKQRCRSFIELKNIAREKNKSADIFISSSFRQLFFAKSCQS